MSDRCPLGYLFLLFPSLHPLYFFRYGNPRFSLSSSPALRELWWHLLQGDFECTLALKLDLGLNKICAKIKQKCFCSCTVFVSGTILKDFVTNAYIRYQSCICRLYLDDLKFLIVNRRISIFYVYFWTVFAGISIGKLQIRMLGKSSFSIRQFDWLGFLSIASELYTKIDTVRHPSECADASKVATRWRSDACGSY